MTGAVSLLEYSAQELSRLVQRRDVSPVELVQAVSRKLDETEAQLGAFILRLDDLALAEARAHEQEILRGHYRGPLHGIPYAVKDNIAVANTVTTAGSRILANSISLEDAAVVARLREAGAIVVGKTNLSEFALSSTTINPFFGTTHNPRHPDRIAGGSSGGSAASVAAGQIPLAIGTDTLGSVRMPASACGIVGLKPTHGLVSVRGIVAPTNISLDHIGPLARTVGDAALLLEGMAGYEPADATSRATEKIDFRHAADDPTRSLASHRRLRIGVPRNYYFDLIDPEVERAVTGAIQELERHGATIVEVAIPELEELMHARIALQAEGLAFHGSHLRAHPELYSDGLRARLFAMYFVTAADVERANRARRVVAERFAAVFREVDILAAPTTPTPAFPLDAQLATVRDNRTGEDVGQYAELLFLRLTAPANLAGIPSLSLPCGFSADGLPIGLQLIAPPFRDAQLLTVGAAYEAIYSRDQKGRPSTQES